MAPTPMGLLLRSSALPHGLPSQGYPPRQLIVRLYQEAFQGHRDTRLPWYLQFLTYKILGLLRWPLNYGPGETQC